MEDEKHEKKISNICSISIDTCNNMVIARTISDNH